jgi:hypothetical protein
MNETLIARRFVHPFRDTAVSMALYTLVRSIPSDIDAISASDARDSVHRVAGISGNIARSTTLLSDDVNCNHIASSTAFLLCLIDDTCNIHNVAHRKRAASTHYMSTARSYTSIVRTHLTHPCVHWCYTYRAVGELHVRSTYTYSTQWLIASSLHALSLIAHMRSTPATHVLSRECCSRYTREYRVSV